MLLLLLTGALLSPAGEEAVKQFRPVENTEVPRVILEEKIDCPLGDVEECWRNFLGTGQAWRGDVNDDGKDELLVLPGALWSGTGGTQLFLFQKRKDGWSKIAGWFAAGARQDILPVVRRSYHDICLEKNTCLKWAGEGYEAYVAEDYHRLSPEFFDRRDIHTAEMFWKIRNAGKRKFVVEPFWVSDLPNWSVTQKLADPEQGLEWWATFKGGVYGVRDEEAFLLLPRPGYLGAKLKLDGDWLLIYEPEDPPGEPVARYNRRTRQMIIAPEE